MWKQWEFDQEARSKISGLQLPLRRLLTKDEIGIHRFDRMCNVDISGGMDRK